MWLLQANLDHVGREAVVIPATEINVIPAIETDVIPATKAVVIPATKTDVVFTHAPSVVFNQPLLLLSQFVSHVLAKHVR